MDFKKYILLLAACIIIDRANGVVFNGCTEINSGAIITCNTANSPFPSRTATGIVSTVIDILLIQNQNFATIPDSSLSGLTINNYLMRNNGLSSITANAFTGTTKLTSATFSESGLNSIVSTAFDPIKASLTTLSFTSSGMTNTRFETVKDGIQGLNALSTLTLDTNSLISLNAGWLNGLTGLKVFSAKSNQIQSVQADAFKFNTAITEVDLSSNQLTDMAALNTALSPLVGTLQKLTLSSNRFTTVNDFSAFTALKSLKLNSNLLATISSSNSFVGMPALTDIKNIVIKLTKN